MFDPENEIDIDKIPPKSKANVNSHKVFIDEGIYPKYRGGYHMYHKIDGKVVAVGVIDLLNTTFVSCYLIRDPDYSNLRLGVVTAIKEMEYMKLIKDTRNPQMRYYHLGEFVYNC